ncbi:hypothetical protein K1T71_006670 [Dendrolimus kikuchii]|uniref:Uncharacterized protein n=1 Tax=Dendrolimus kikuchii TaxID=765133 RepID=A0ACC1D1T1_9NEOP|nr:hypothetical protein K1T71_006670 [Dendrolimus kikuchii]
MMASVLDLVKHYQHTIEKYPSDEQRILKCIDKLFNLDVTVQHLQDTGVGRTVNALRKEPEEVGKAARSLVSKWKLMVAAEESDQDNERNNDTTTYNGHDSRKDPENTSKQSRSSHDGYEKKSSSHHKEQSQEMNGSYSGNKRKYHSSEEEEPDLKKSKHNSSSDSDNKNKSEIKIKKESTESESEDYDSQTDDSDSEMSESSKEEIKVKEEIRKGHSKDHKSNSSKHLSHTNHKDAKLSSKSKSCDSSEKYTKHRSSQSKERHSSEKRSSKERSTSHRHKSSTKEKDKDEVLEKKQKSHKSSESEKSKKDSKSSSSKESNSDKHKSSHKSDSEKHKSSSEKHSSRSDKHKNSANSSNEKEKYKNSSEKESSSSKHMSKENGNKDKHSSSSKDKSKDRSTSKDKSSSHSEKHLSSDSKSSSSNDKSRHDKSDDKSSDKKSKQKSSSSSEHKSSKSSNSKSKDDVPKTKVQISSHTEDSDDGIDCGSGASFAEALGMISPVKPKKKSLKDINSPINSFNNDLSPAALLAPNAKLAPLPALDISALPEISPNYKPRPPPKLLPHFTDEDAMNHVISSKNQRTKVYSGNKVLGKITSLYEMCVHVLQEHIDALEYTGGVPYEILKPVVDRATPQQLFVLEHYNPYLMEDTDHLWQKFCEKSFRNKKRHEMETWREMYMRCQEEQEHKLKSLTANIKLTQEAKKAPIKQTKMAYVDSVVKPPRNIAKKQAVHGTAHTATASPAARVAALAKAANVLRGNTRPSPVTPVSASAINKPKKAPLMQKALQFMRGRKR